MSEQSYRKRRTTPPYLGRALVGRTRPRHRVDLAVTVDSESTFYAGYARDLSAGGLFVDTPIVHPVGTRFNLSLHLADGVEGVVRGIGEVRWVRQPSADGAGAPCGLGIRFITLEKNGVERIRRYLASEDAPPLSDEPVPVAAQSSPLQSSPLQSSPLQSSPLQSSPLQSEPPQSEKPQSEKPCSAAAPSSVRRA